MNKYRVIYSDWNKYYVLQERYQGSWRYFSDYSTRELAIQAAQFLISSPKVIWEGSNK